MREEIQNKEYWDTLIIDHLSDNISEKDSCLLNEWLAESLKHQSYFDGMKELWESSGITNPYLPFDYERAYSLFVKRVHGNHPEASLRPLRKSLVFIRRVTIIAAVIIPFVILGYYTVLYFDAQKPAIELLLSEVVSPNGSKTQLRLADGTVVWLNSGSKLFYNNGFGKENRVLELEGEAYLNVSHNEEIPLIVKAGGLNVKVLGTKFNVNAYSDNGEIKVSLLEGSVSMTDYRTAGTTVLKPMETGIYQVNTQQITVKKGLDKNALNWMKNQLVFSGETFEEIVHILERRFDVKIRIHNQSLQYRCFGGVFGKEESIDYVLKVWAVYGEFIFTIKEGIIDIY